jgi:hypothetical protein
MTYGPQQYFSWVNWTISFAWPSELPRWNLDIAISISLSVSYYIAHQLFSIAWNSPYLRLRDWQTIQTIQTVSADRADASGALGVLRKCSTDYKMNHVLCRTLRKNHSRVLQHIKTSLRGGSFLKHTPKPVSLARRNFCEVYKPNLQCTRYKSTKNKQSQSAEVNEE